jgi:hypothetical protein
MASVLDIRHQSVGQRCQVAAIDLGTGIGCNLSTELQQIWAAIKRGLQ